MIIRRRTKPLPLQRLEALIPRLRPHFPGLSSIQQDATKRYKGYIGEMKVDYYLDLLPKNYTILHDVCLGVNGKTFQTDSLIITNNAIYLIEAKNYDGTITFNTNLNQFTRDNNKKETGYRYPITQAETHQLQLMDWLHEQGLPPIPVYFFIAISEPSTIIKVIGDEEEIAKVVVHGEHLPNKIMDLDGRLEVGRHENRRVGEAILRECKEYDRDVLQEHKINESDILTGVHCPKCKWLGMERRHSRWECLKCGNVSRNAHLKALKDYFILINPWITNKACMRFLNIHSRNLATRLLKSSQLKYDPKKRRWMRR